MFLLFGLTTRRKTVDQGEFDCPNEGGPRFYQYQSSRRWFTLFFIPLVPLGQGDEWVRCTSCGATYSPDVLRHRSPRPS
jgi:hypothetical protein